MPSDKKQSIRLNSVANELRSLAEDLTNGRLRVGSNTIDVGEPIFFKTKQKVKGEKAYYTLSFQVPVLADEVAENEAAVPEEKAEKPSPKKKTPASTGKKSESPPNGKKIKKDITRLWKSMSRVLEQGNLPTPEDGKKILTLCEDYNLYAAKEWSDDWQQCVAVVKNAYQAAESGETEKAQELIAEVNRLTKICHKKYK